MLISVMELISWLFTGVIVLVSQNPVPKFCWVCAITGVVLHVVSDIVIKTEKRKHKLTEGQIIDLLIADNRRLREENEAMRAETGKEVYEE